MRANSLSLRLVLSSAIVSIVLLVAAAFLLAGLFSTALERNFDARLRAVLDGLLANVDVGSDGSPVLSQQLADTRFSLPQSGWYWQVEPPPNSKLKDLASESLLEQRLKPEPSLLASRDKNGIATFYMWDSRQTKLRVIEQDFKLAGSSTRFSFLVAGNFDELRDEVQAFRHTLFTVLALLGAGLLAATMLQVTFGLRPLKLMQQRLSAIREGKSDRMEGVYPSEIQPIAEELNLLIQSNTEIINRARTQVGNLAHALKTPLSVLTNEATIHHSPLADKVTEQTQVMRDQVSLYLDRARRAARAQGLGAVTEVKPVLEALARTLQRINQDRGITIAVVCDDGLKFRGEKQDLEEMAGNLMDNACKWSKAHVEVVAETVKGQAAAARPWLDVRVDDDGPGLPADKRAEALKRGRRIDESKPGSGLGLNIVAETAGMYGGKIELADAELGGLRVLLRLPAAG
ncbi:MAG: sensor histidine kinase [Rhizobiales bacterium]|nr:sensor histidine kinase [Hyphomicrobiales bacterium]MBI3674354.1 sensor histidine kinase [Hyphomicrobiales bacterium]